MDEPQTARLTAVLRNDHASEELLPLVYDELRRLAHARLAHCKPGQTLQATALVHEAWMRVAGSKPSSWEGRAHFFGAASLAMRNILVEEARKKQSLKRGTRREDKDPDGCAIESPVDDIVAVHEALEGLEREHPKMARIVTLRFFGDLSMKEIAEMVGDPLRTVERLWSYARAWLEREVNGVGEA